MLVTCSGVFLRYSEGTSKNGYPYKLVELGGSDYRKCTVAVPDELVPALAVLHGGDNVTASITLESGYNGLRGELHMIQKK